MRTTSAPSALPFDGSPTDGKTQPLRSVAVGMMVTHFGLRVRVLMHHPHESQTTVEADAPGRGRQQLESSTLVVVVPWAEQANRYAAPARAQKRPKAQQELF